MVYQERQVTVSLKYPMERLGPFGFQDLAAALALRVFGAKVHPMGRGRDRGRDMITTDPVRWSDDVLWNGATVFQVKHKSSLSTPAPDASWLWGQIRKELDLWASPDSGRGIPEQLVFVTNVPLTPAEGGTFDGLRTSISKWFEALSDSSAEDAMPAAEKRAARHEREARRERMATLRCWEVLDREYLERSLDAHRDVRLAIDGFLQVGDVLADLSRFSTTLCEKELSPALKQHTRWALTNERKIHFDDAGADQKGFPVEDVVIDLPVHITDADGPEKVVRYVLNRGDHILKPSLASLNKPRHLVIVGAPGNGKTTVSKFLVHAYRAAWLGEDTDLGDEHRKTVQGTFAALQRMGRAVPANRRWPFRVDLAHFATKRATNSDYTLLTYMVETLSAQVAAKPITKSTLAPWLKAWPSLLLLDGLDEVAEPRVRKGLIADIEAFVNEAESNDLDTLVVVTTRPTGYDTDLSASVFEQVDLADLSIEDALTYGRQITRARVPDEQARRDGIIKLLEGAAREESLQRLLRTPLQVLIMTIIAEAARQFAPSRFELFWGYYTTVEQRERGKTLLGYATLIRDHPSEVLDLHCRAGLLLQERAETAVGSESVLSPDDLKDLAWSVLTDAGHDPAARDRDLLERIITAVTHRLVLLTPRHGGGFGFDVRSLQELMAARALTTGQLDDTLVRLKVIGASPHWRNTFLFAIGRYFAERQPHQKEAATRLILALDENVPERMGASFPVGPTVAIEIVDDGMATEPRYLHPLVKHAMRALWEPEMYNRHTFPRILMAAAGSSDAVRGLIAEGLRGALGGSPAAQMNAEEIKAAIQALGPEIGASSDVLGLATVKRDPTKSPPPEAVADWDAFRADLYALAEPHTAGELAAVYDRCRQVAGARLDDDAAFELSLYLSEPEIASIVDVALPHIAPAEPLLVAWLRSQVLPTIWRRPVLGSDLGGRSAPADAMGLGAAD